MLCTCHCLKSQYRSSIQNRNVINVVLQEFSIVKVVYNATTIIHCISGKRKELWKTRKKRTHKCMSYALCSNIASIFVKRNLLPCPKPSQAKLLRFASLIQLAWHKSPQCTVVCSDCSPHGMHDISANTLASRVWDTFMMDKIWYSLSTEYRDLFHVRLTDCLVHWLLILITGYRHWHYCPIAIFLFWQVWGYFLPRIKA